MRISKLCILACCIGVSGSTFLATQTAAQSSQSAADDQTKALEALRQAEAGPIVPDVIASNAAPAAPVPAPEAAAVAAPAATPAPESSQIVAPAPAITPSTASAEDQNKALDALRQAEKQPVTVDQSVPSAIPAGFKGSPEALTARQKEAQLIEAQRQRKLAEEKAITDRTAIAEAAKRQQEEDEIKVKQAIEAEKAATEKARTDLAAIQENARRQQEQDDLRIKESAEAERIAAEQVRVAKAEEAAAAERARIAKERAEAAERARIAKAQADAERLKKQMQSEAAMAPGSAPDVTPPSAKEQKLAELLRRYQADQITPYEYHVQRAKIIAEP